MKEIILLGCLFLSVGSVSSAFAEVAGGEPPKMSLCWQSIHDLVESDYKVPDACTDENFGFLLYGALFHCWMNKDEDGKNFLFGVIEECLRSKFPSPYLP